MEAADVIKRWMVTGLLALVLGTGMSSAQDDDISPALEEQMLTLEAVTQELRGLQAERDIERQFPTRAETIAYLEETYSREFPPEEFDRLQRFYVALGLLAPEIDLQDVYLNLLGSQIAGFYDSDTEVMNVLPIVGDDTGDSLSLTEQVIYVHEFTHALQDQHFDLDALLEAPEVLSNSDRSLATLALVEGDASATMTLYLTQVAERNPLAALGMLVEGIQGGTLFLPEGIPSILVDELMFPYDAGMNFVIAISEEDGWDTVNAAYDNPPTTSEQILHPEKYLAGEGALDVSLSDLSGTLDTGWVEDWSTTLGEFYLRKMLDTQLSSADAAAGAAGWGGDHLRVYHESDSGAIAFALKIAWDSDAERDEFATLFEGYGDGRYGEDGRTEYIGCWAGDTDALCILTSEDAAETLIVSAPTIDAALALRDAALGKTSV
jgi:hypothetical protein